MEVEISEKLVGQVVDLIYRNQKYRHSLITAFTSIGDVGYEEAKRVFRERTGAGNSVCNAISFFGRKFEKHGVCVPDGDELSLMVNGLFIDRTAAVIKSRYVRRKSEKPSDRAKEYYTREGYWRR